MTVTTRSASKRIPGAASSTRRKATYPKRNTNATTRRHSRVTKTLPASSLVVTDDNESPPPPSIRISPRQNDCTKNSWWMVDLDSEETPKQGVTRLVARCMRKHCWNIEKARRVLKAYRQFLELKKKFQDWDASILSPSLYVDQMWHEHILDVTNYCHDTMLLCGHIVGHNPDGGLDAQAKAERTKMTRQALTDHYVGEEMDFEIWLTLQEWRAKQEEDRRKQEEDRRKQEEERRRARFEALLETHVVQSIGRNGQTSGRVLTIVMELSNGEKQVIKIGSRQRMSLVLSWYADRIYTGPESSVDDFVFKYWTTESRTTLATIEPNQTAEDLQLKTGDSIKVVLVNTPITIRVRDQVGEETIFRMLLSTPMRILFETYAQRKRVPSHEIRFMVDGYRIDPDQTSVMLGLEDQDCLDCMRAQSGC